MGQQNDDAPRTQVRSQRGARCPAHDAGRRSVAQGCAVVRSSRELAQPICDVGPLIGSQGRTRWGARKDTSPGQILRSVTGSSDRSCRSMEEGNGRIDLDGTDQIMRCVAYSLTAYAL